MEKIIQFANLVDGRKPDAENSLSAKDPRVRILTKLITDDEAEVALLLTRKPLSVGDIAAKGGRPAENIRPILDKLAQVGVIFMTFRDNEPYYNLVGWVPGIIEFVMVKKEVLDEEMAQLFNQVIMAGSKGAPNIPKGVGVMRTIPVAQAIEAESRRASYEEIVTYLDQSDIYSAADCACRMAAQVRGEGCEHPVEGMCIQIGPHAEYYIRTGRGRRLTREEVLALLQKAEREGLVHQIFNTEGVNRTSFICNCCGCSCGILQHAVLFKVPDFCRSNYVAQVDKDKCVACGVCVEYCNANALTLGEAICKPKILDAIEEIETPYDTEWGKDRWNRDFRVRKMVGDCGTSPCKAECPAHISIQGYIKKASQGKYDEALRVIKRDNPFPAVCGRICPRACESMCTRSDIDEPLAIDDIKKFIADKDLNSTQRYKPQIWENRPEKVAVIGAGPAGLSCAYYLAVEGYKVTVFEKQAVLGGMLTLGIPSFRLERDVINAEIDVIRELGVEFKTGVEVGRDYSIQQLRKQGYKAFYIAIGAQSGRKLGMEGEDLPGVTSGVDFLRDVNLGQVNLKGSVIVIGGGNVAIDVARVAIRCGAASVDMFSLETRNEMPALEEEILDALEEGINIHPSWGPHKIISQDGRVTGMEFKKCISAFDADGSFSPKFDENTTIKVAADLVIASIGQSIAWGGLITGSEMTTNPNHTIKVDEISFQTAEPDIFAGGDIVTGPKFAIDAIAAGKQGATSIHRFIQGRSLTMRRESEYRPLDRENLNLDGYDCLERQKPAPIDRRAAKHTFHDLHASLTEEQISKETQRCLGCGIVRVDEYQCIGCGICTTKCEFDAIHLFRQYDAPSIEPKEIRNAIKNYAMERAQRIARKKEEQADHNASLL